MWAPDLCQCLFLCQAQKSRRPASQLWSSFFTLLSSLTWALVRAGAADSAAWPATDACSGLVPLDSISSSESSSSFSLSISSSACLFSSLRSWKKKKKRNVTLHILRDKQQSNFFHVYGFNKDLKLLNHVSSEFLLCCVNSYWQGGVKHILPHTLSININHNDCTHLQFLLANYWRTNIWIFIQRMCLTECFQTSFKVLLTLCL